MKVHWLQHLPEEGLAVSSSGGGRGGAALGVAADQQVQRGNERRPFAAKANVGSCRTRTDSVGCERLATAS